MIFFTKLISLKFRRKKFVLEIREGKNVRERISGEQIVSGTIFSISEKILSQQKTNSLPP
jgi:hypothetical protein